MESIKNKNKIKRIYEILYSQLGPQNWWPVTDKDSIIPAYKKRDRLTKKQRLEICFGAILTQNTNWKNAEKSIINLNKNKLIDINKIIKTEGEKLAEIIKSSGYHNQKAKKLKNLCNFFLENYNGDIELLFNENIAELRKKLLSVNGIGPETADSIILYAAQKPIFVADAYTRRIFNRIGFKEKTYDELQGLFMGSLDHNMKILGIFSEYHALIVELGKNVCKKNPMCGICPLNKICEFESNYKKENI